MTVVWNSGSYAALCMNLGEMWKVALHFIAHLHTFCRLMSNCCKKKNSEKNGKTSIYTLYLGKILLNPTKVKKKHFYHQYLIILFMWGHNCYIID